ncbi:MAG: alpha/beta fold hydrolase [Sphingomonas sp.]
MSRKSLVRSACRNASGVFAAVVMLSASAASAQQSVPEVQIEAPGPQGRLAGTTIEGAAGEPVVLIIPGSGPTDRNGDNPLGVRGGVYRQLAVGLAARGIASVRVDKRGMFGSRAAVTDPNDVTIADYASDVRSWIAAIRKRTGAPCVWVLGHSEGGLVALVAAQSAPDICGLLLVAAMGRPLADVMRQQLKANPANAPVLGQALAAIDSLEAGKTFDPAGLHPALASMFATKVQGYLIDFFRYDPAKLAAAYKGPMLVLQGNRDLQVTLEDASILKNAHLSAKLVIVPGVNHVLKPVAGSTMAANFATYGDASLAIDPAVVDGVATAVLGVGRR